MPFLFSVIDKWINTRINIPNSYYVKPQVRFILYIINKIYFCEGLAKNGDLRSKTKARNESAQEPIAQSYPITQK